MATSLPTRLTLAHRREIQGLTRVTIRQTRSAVLRADVAAIDNWWTQRGAPDLERIIVRGHDVAVQMTTRYMLAHAAASGAEVAPLASRLDMAQVHANLFVVGPAAFLTALRRTGSQPAATRVLRSGLIGTVVRFVMAGERETMMATWRAGR